MQQAAKDRHLPFNACGFHFGFENIPVVLWHDRVFCAVHHADRCFDVSALGRKWRQQIAVQTDNRLQIRAGARQLKNIAAAKAEADGGLAFEIANLALDAFATKGVKRGTYRLVANMALAGGARQPGRRTATKAARVRVG